MSDRLFDPGEAVDDFKPWQKPEPRSLARLDDPETSHVAARALSGKAGTMRRALLDAFSTADLTAEEVQDAAGYVPADGSWKRVSDLGNAKLIEPTGEVRVASTGRPQRVWRITEAGKEALVK